MKLLIAWCGFLLIAAATPVSAQPAGEAETAIRNALSRWTSDFNTRDAAHICDLFAKDLLYDYRGFPERDYESLCSLLRRSLADQTKKFAYSLDIKEVIVAGDLAVVRLVWRLKVTVPGAADAVESKEPGLMYFAGSRTAAGRSSAMSLTRSHEAFQSTSRCARPLTSWLADDHDTVSGCFRGIRRRAVFDGAAG